MKKLITILAIFLTFQGFAQLPEKVSLQEYVNSEVTKIYSYDWNIRINNGMIGILVWENTIIDNPLIQDTLREPIRVYIPVDSVPAFTNALFDQTTQTMIKNYLKNYITQ